MAFKLSVLLVILLNSKGTSGCSDKLDKLTKVMPPDMAISMRHNKLKASEAALLAGELNKPSWESRNEGIHERVTFEDTIWGFDLAGGSYYKTPLRVTYVKKDSRADKAGIRPGDKLKRINDIDTSTLTIQEAHDIIVSSGVHLKLAVTAPEDEQDSYHCYQDELNENGYDSDEERRREEELARKRQVHARVSHYWSLQWPWVSKRRVIYRESNCFLVPSKFEDKHKEKFPPRPFLRTEEDTVLGCIKKENIFKCFDKESLDKEQDLKKKIKSKENSVEPETALVNGNQNIAPLKEILTNGAVEIRNTKEHEVMQRFLSEVPQVKVDDEQSKEETTEANENISTSETNEITNGQIQDPEPTEEIQSVTLPNDTINGEVHGPDLIEEPEPELSPEDVINEILNETENITEQQQDEILDSIDNEVIDTQNENQDNTDER